MDKHTAKIARRLEREYVSKLLTDDEIAGWVGNQLVGNISEEDAIKIVRLVFSADHAELFLLMTELTGKALKSVAEFDAIKEAEQLEAIERQAYLERVTAGMHGEHFMRALADV